MAITGRATPSEPAEEFDAPVIAHEGVRTRILNTDMAEHAARVGTFGPEEPALLEGYRANPPIITFQDGMTLRVGDHTFEMIHMPGHTLYQAAVVIKEEGVVFTSDNIFHGVQTWLHECNPDLWLVALESLRKLERDKAISQDQNRRSQDQLQKTTDSFIKNIDQVSTTKEAEIMQV